MQVKRALIICGLATGFALSAYSIFTKFNGRFRSLWCRGQKTQIEEAQKVSNKNKMLKSIKSAKPLRMWIDGKCFNIRKFKRNTKKTSQRTIIRTDCNTAKS